MTGRGVFRVVLAWAACLGCVLALAGCAVRETTVAKAPANVPLQTATKADLVAKFNEIAESIRSINAGVAMQWTASSTYTGVIKQYPRLNGFILAQKPEMIRVIGQAPVIGTNIFDMVSDGKTFSIYVPSKNQFLTGPAKLEKPSEKPLENLRPQHLMDAIFWQPIPAADPVLFEEAMDNGESDYVLTVATRGPSDRGGGAEDWKIACKIWFERAGLTLARIETYGGEGQLESDIHYGQWGAFGDVQYPKQITVARPDDGYTLAITVTKLTPNETIEASRFVLPQPAGAQLVRAGESTAATGPAGAASPTAEGGQN